MVEHLRDFDTISHGPLPEPAVEVAGPRLGDFECAEPVVCLDQFPGKFLADEFTVFEVEGASRPLSVEGDR